MFFTPIGVETHQEALESGEYGTGVYFPPQFLGDFTFEIYLRSYALTMYNQVTIDITGLAPIELVEVYNTVDLVNQDLGDQPSRIRIQELVTSEEPSASEAGLDFVGEWKWRELDHDREVARALAQALQWNPEGPKLHSLLTELAGYPPRFYESELSCLIEQELVPLTGRVFAFLRERHSRSHAISLALARVLVARVQILARAPDKGGLLRLNSRLTSQIELAREFLRRARRTARKSQLPRVETLEREFERALVCNSPQQDFPPCPECGATEVRENIARESVCPCCGLVRSGPGAVAHQPRGSPEEYMKRVHRAPVRALGVNRAPTTFHVRRDDPGRRRWKRLKRENFHVATNHAQERSLIKVRDLARGLTEQFKYSGSTQERLVEHIVRLYAFFAKLQDTMGQKTELTVAALFYYVVQGEPYVVPLVDLATTIGSMVSEIRARHATLVGIMKEKHLPKNLRVSRNPARWPLPYIDRACTKLDLDFPVKHGAGLAQFHKKFRTSGASPRTKAAAGVVLACQALQVAGRDIRTIPASSTYFTKLASAVGVQTDAIRKFLKKLGNLNGLARVLAGHAGWIEAPAG